MDSDLDLSVVIVNRNTRDLLEACLESLLADLESSHLKCEIIVVDNASSDGSPELVAARFPKVILLRNRENRGYAAANNQAIRQARGARILLLNSDTVVKPGAIEGMVSGLERHPGAAGVAPKLLNPDGRIQQSCWPFPMKALLGGALGLYRLRLLDDYRAWGHRYDREVDWVSSAAMLVPRRVFDHVGLLDDRFFYGADAEWAHRAATAGYRFVSLADPEIVHFGKGSRPKGSRVEERFAGGPAAKAKYFRKFYGRRGVLLFRVLLIAGNLPRWIIWEAACRFNGKESARIRATQHRRMMQSAMRLRLEDSAAFPWLNGTEQTPRPMLDDRA